MQPTRHGPLIYEVDAEIWLSGDWDAQDLYTYTRGASFEYFIRIQYLMSEEIYLYKTN